MCMLNVSCLFKADDESPSNLPMEALLHSEEAPPPAGDGGLPDFDPLARLTLPVTTPELALTLDFMVWRQRGCQTRC